MQPGRAAPGKCCHCSPGRFAPPAASTSLSISELATTACVDSIHVRTVNDEDVRLTCRQTRHIKEVHMVLRNSHDWLVTVGVNAGFAHLRPRKRATARGFELGHVQEEQAALGQRIYPLVQ